MIILKKQSAQVWWIRSSEVNLSYTANNTSRKTQMKPQYTVERMTKSEVQTAIEWANAAGWNPGLNDAECFYNTDPNGFFVGKLDGKTIALGSAVNYDDNFAFCGFYIVDNAYRGKGYGLQLTKARLAYVGHRNAGLDGVVEMLDKYARIGYKIAHYNARYQTTSTLPQPEENKAIMPLVEIDFNLVSEFDRRQFPALRPSFLKSWINQAGAKSLGYFENGVLYGYGVIRPCQKGYKIGPLFAETPAIAKALLLQLALHAKDQTFFLDIPENNPSAIELVHQYQFIKVFATARMYLKGQPAIEMQNIYGITTFELG